MSTPKYPEIKLQLTGQDGNAFNILGLVKRALKKNNVSHDEILQYINEATSGDYDHLLSVTTKWVTVS